MEEDEIIEHYGANDDIIITNTEAKPKEKKKEAKKETKTEKVLYAEKKPEKNELKIEEKTVNKHPENKRESNKMNKEEKITKPKKHKKVKKKTPTVTIISIIAILIIIGLSLLIVFWQDIFKTTQSEDVVAIVNGEIITKAQLDYNYNISVPAGFRILVSKETFLNKSYIPQILLLQEAKKNRIEITNEEVQEQIDLLLLQNKLTLEEFEGQLAEDNLKLEDIKELFKTRLIISELMNTTIGSELEVTDTEVQQYYQNNIEEFTAQEGQIRAAHILLDTEELANEVLERLGEGEDFGYLARRESLDVASAGRDGDLGFFTKDQMIPEFGEAAFALEIGEVSDIVESQFGYHIIKRLPDTIPLEEVEDQIEQALLSGKQNAAMETYINQLRSKAEIEIFSIQEAAASNIPLITGEASKINTFSVTKDPICEENGKPIIRLFSTTRCPHCTWIKNTFDSVVKEYIDSGQIIAHHWELDIGDDTLTLEKESKIPTEEFEIYRKYSPGGVPTYVFGCKYVRIGNGYESINDLEAEEAEFRAAIEKLIS